MQSQAMKKLQLSLPATVSTTYVTSCPGNWNCPSACVLIVNPPNRTSDRQTLILGLTIFNNPLGDNEFELAERFLFHHHLLPEIEEPGLVQASARK